MESDLAENKARAAAAREGFGFQHDKKVRDFLLILRQLENQKKFLSLLIRQPRLMGVATEIFSGFTSGLTVLTLALHI